MEAGIKKKQTRGATQGPTATNEVRMLLLSSIVESSDDAIMGKTPYGIITSWNPAAEAMYGSG